VGLVHARGMHPNVMYELVKYDMAETQRRARHARLIAESRPVSRWDGLRARLRRAVPAGVPARAPVASVKQAA
jgi:hypothetical protein